MTYRAERVKAFCERTVDYQRTVNAMRKQEYGMLADAEEFGYPIEEHAGYKRLRENKIDVLGKMTRAKLQVLNITEESPLTAKQARAIDLRYRYALSWQKIRQRMKYESRQTVYNVRDEAYEMMADALDRLYPDWQIGDE